MKITIFGKGNMGKAIGDNFDACGNEVEYAGREFIGELGDIHRSGCSIHGSGRDSQKMGSEDEG